MPFYHDGKKLTKKDVKQYQKNKKKYQDKFKHQPKKTPHHVWGLSAPSQRKQILQRAGVNNRVLGKFPFRKSYANLTPKQKLLWENTLIYLRDKLGVFLIS